MFAHRITCYTDTSLFSAEHLTLSLQTYQQKSVWQHPGYLSRLSSSNGPGWTEPCKSSHFSLGTHVVNAGLYFAPR